MFTNAHAIYDRHVDRSKVSLFLLAYMALVFSKIGKSCKSHTVAVQKYNIR